MTNPLKKALVWTFILLLPILAGGCNITSSSYEAQYNLGLNSLSTGKFEAAVKAFSSAIKKDPGQPLVYVGRGDAYAALGQYQKAAADYEQALALDPTPPDLRHKLADIYTALGETDKALALQLVGSWSTVTDMNLNCVYLFISGGIVYYTEMKMATDDGFQYGGTYSVEDGRVVLVFNSLSRNEQLRPISPTRMVLRAEIADVQAAENPKNQSIIFTFVSGNVLPDSKQELGVSGAYSAYTWERLDLVKANGGLNQRIGPDTTYESLQIIPDTAYVIVLAYTEDTTWAYVNYAGKLGWANSSYIQTVY